MTKETRIKYLKIALNLQGINVSSRMCDQVIETLELVNHKGDDFTLKDAVELELSIERKYKEKELKVKKTKS